MASRRVRSVITSIVRKRISTGVVSSIFILIVMMLECGGAVVIETRIIQAVSIQSMRAKKMTTMMMMAHVMDLNNSLNI